MDYKYAAAIIVLDRKVLLLKRSEKEDDEAGKWCPVNESIDEGEAPEKAVVRGVKEETGMEFTITRRLPDHTYDGDTAVFLGGAKGEIKPDPEEVAGYGWFSFKETMDLDFAYGYEKVIENVYRLEYLD